MSVAQLHAHLATGHTHVSQCWAIERKDGVTFGFTDHDRSLAFEGITFLADSGLSASALSSSTGLSVNDSEAMGLLQADVITEADIIAGHYDGAKATNWLVCWDDVEARQIKFVGTIGEITRRNGSFEAELRGLSEALNQPQGRSYLRGCSALLGDSACRIDLSDPSYRVEAAIAAIEAGVIQVPLTSFTEGWFAQGVMTVQNGTGAGFTASIKSHRLQNGTHELTLWEPLPSGVSTGDTVELRAGCDKAAATCQGKFSNIANFQGFPHIPGDDWLMSVPRADGSADGESMNS